MARTTAWRGRHYLPCGACLRLCHRFVFAGRPNQRPPAEGQCGGCAVVKRTRKAGAVVGTVGCRNDACSKKRTRFCLVWTETSDDCLSVVQDCCIRLKYT